MTSEQDSRPSGKVDICDICKKPSIKYEQTISRWTDSKGKEIANHHKCEVFISGHGPCPQCGGKEVKLPREGAPYCEDCGFPDEDFIDLEQPEAAKSKAGPK